MANKIRFKRGVKSQLPALDVGEPGFCTDTEELFIGGTDGNINVLKDFKGYEAKHEKLGFWEDEGQGANIWKFGDRVLIGDAVDYNGKNGGIERSWVGRQANGLMTYFDGLSQMAAYSKIGCLGIASASRSSDNPDAALMPPSLPTIGIASYVINDNNNPANKRGAWAFYGHADHAKDNSSTFGMELDVCNTSGAAFVKTNPYLMGAPGTTANIWLGVGGETVHSGIPSTAYVSCAIGIVANGEGDFFSKYEKGIVFQHTALARNSKDHSIAMQMAKGHEISWCYDGAEVGAKIRSDVSGAIYAQKIVFENAALAIKGVATDLSTEINLLKIYTNNNAVNNLAIAPSISGEPIDLVAEGNDINVDIRIKPKGNGMLNYALEKTWATTPANFSAVAYIPIKANGSVYYIPISNTTW